MLKRNPAEEIIMDGDRAIRFVSDFGFAQAISSLGKDVQRITLELCDGSFNPENIRDVLACSMRDVDGVELSAVEKQDYAEHLIEQYGLAELALAARYICIAIQVGDVKKQQLQAEDQTKEIIKSLLPSSSVPFWKVGLLWAVMCLSSTIAACTIIKLFILPSV